MPDAWKKMSYFALRIENQPGELARFAQKARDAGVNFMGLWGYAPGVDEPHMACVPENPDVFRAFARSDDFPGSGRVEEGTTFYMNAEDSPGALVGVLSRIAEAGVNVESIECVSAGPRFGCFLWAEPSQIEALEKVLTAEA